MSSLQILQPPDWPSSKGYSNGIAARGQQVFIAGQIGWDREQKFRSSKLSDQTRQVLENIVAVLTEAGGKPEHIVRLTWYVTSREDYLAQLKDIGVAYRAVMGKHYPAMTCVQVVALIEREAQIEIEATAVIPDVASA